ncbi:MAG: sigma 54-interacting transcriptional regulator [FCB group bacterium]|jgi:DNA-binding NtrC family response regulator|nr:sigma 54-interacting transcriptional regulator [FCB group bacterium]
MDVLLALAGPRDPYVSGLATQEEPGPLLTLLRARPFDRILLLSTPATATAAHDTVEAMRSECPACEVELREIPLYDFTSYSEILRELQRLAADLRGYLPHARWYISVASCPSEVHACWMLLAAGGDFRAQIIQVRPPQPGSADLPVVTEVNPQDPDFPVVPGRGDRVREAYLGPPELDDALRQIGIVGDHPGLRFALDRAGLAAPSDASILIFGETGTGKELFARLIHRLSDRAHAPFVSINCGAVPKDLVESVLFGHVRGAFTGATQDYRGKFCEADGGTLFLDELLELPPDSQVKLLRVLEDGIVEPLGSSRSRRVSVRVVAATNRDPHKAIKNGQFREDLYHRVGTVEIILPPLRERAEDIPKLALHLLDNINRQLRRPKRLSPNALARLQSQGWRGNVRDLRNTLVRSAMFCREDIIDADDLQLSSGGEPAPFAFLPRPHEGFKLREYIDEIRRRLIERALEDACGNQSRAAQLLGISPQALHKYLSGQAERSTLVDE